jgi:hypothetical protein
MATAKQLEWHDVEDRPSDSGIRAYPQNAAIPLVHRIDRPDEDVYVEPDVEVEQPQRASVEHSAFFASPSSAAPRDAFEDLDDEFDATWEARRGRRALVKAVAAISFIGVVVLAVFAGGVHAGARSAVTEWATLGAVH